MSSLPDLDILPQFRRPQMGLVPKQRSVRRRPAGRRPFAFDPEKPWAAVRFRDGYRLVKPVAAHPYRLLPGATTAARGWDAEHRVVMAMTLGRALSKSETVHHRNGRRADNRPQNLELWSGPIKAGQRADDLIADWLARLPEAQYQAALLRAAYLRTATIEQIATASRRSPSADLGCVSTGDRPLAATP